jgi:thioredoxin reductase (NADPH)
VNKATTTAKGVAMHDIAIVGGGPAGLSAAITARARDKSVVIISNAAQENPLAKSKLVDNYPGLPDITGLALLERMHAHAHKLGTQFIQARVISVLPIDGAGTPDAAGNPRPSFAITTSSDYLEAQSVIIACGAASGGKPINGEQEYLGRGVSYCATCDGMLYRSSTIVVAGLSAEAPDEANFLAGLGATVHYVSQTLPQSLDSKIHHHRGKLLQIEGDELGLKQVIISQKSADADSDADKDTDVGTDVDTDAHDQKTSSLDESRQSAISCKGVFILRPSVAPTALLSTLKLVAGYIGVNDRMQTNIDGVFAAGDCVGKPLQVAKAVGQGQIAVLSAVEYLDS